MSSSVQPSCSPPLTRGSRNSVSTTSVSPVWSGYYLMLLPECTWSKGSSHWEILYDTQKCDGNVKLRTGTISPLGKPASLGHHYSSNHHHLLLSDDFHSFSAVLHCISINLCPSTTTTSQFILVPMAWSMPNDCWTQKGDIHFSADFWGRRVGGRENCLHLPALHSCIHTLQRPLSWSGRCMGQHWCQSFISSYRSNMRVCVVEGHTVPL